VRGSEGGDGERAQDAACRSTAGLLRASKLPVGCAMRVIQRRESMRASIVSSAKASGESSPCSMHRQLRGPGLGGATTSCSMWQGVIVDR